MGNNLGEISRVQHSVPPDLAASPALVLALCPRQIPSPAHQQNLSFLPILIISGYVFLLAGLLASYSALLSFKSNQAMSSPLPIASADQNLLKFFHYIDRSFVARLIARKRVVCMKVGEEGKREKKSSILC